MLIAIILGLVAGASSVWPVSGFGHVLFAAEIAHWPKITAQSGGSGLPFVVFFGLSQLAAGIVLLVWQRAAWREIIRGAIRTARLRKVHPDDIVAQLSVMVVISVVVSTILLLLFDHTLRTMFGKPFFGILFTITQGVFFLRSDRAVPQTQIALSRKRRRETTTQANTTEKELFSYHDHLSVKRTASIGSLQLFNVLPGFSTIGMGALMGMRYGLSRLEAVQFAALLSGPVFSMYGLSQLGAFLHFSGMGKAELLVGFLLAGVSAVIGLRLLLKYLRTMSFRRVGWYCIGLAVFMLLLALIRGSAQH